jgi:hypothetical protein
MRSSAGAEESCGKRREEPEAAGLMLRAGLSGIGRFIFIGIILSPA